MRLGLFRNVPMLGVVLVIVYVIQTRCYFTQISIFGLNWGKGHQCVLARLGETGLRPGCLMSCGTAGRGSGPRLLRRLISKSHRLCSWGTEAWSKRQTLRGAAKISLTWPFLPLREENGWGKLIIGTCPCSMTGLQSLTNLSFATSTSLSTAKSVSSPSFSDKGK